MQTLEEGVMPLPNDQSSGWFINLAVGEPYQVLYASPEIGCQASILI